MAFGSFSLYALIYNDVAQRCLRILEVPAAQVLATMLPNASSQTESTCKTLPSIDGPGSRVPARSTCLARASAIDPARSCQLDRPGSLVPARSTWLARPGPIDLACSSWPYRPGSLVLARSSWPARPGPIDLTRSTWPDRPGPLDLARSIWLCHHSPTISLSTSLHHR